MRGRARLRRSAWSIVGVLIACRPSGAAAGALRPDRDPRQRRAEPPSRDLSAGNRQSRPRHPEPPHLRGADLAAGRARLGRRRRGRSACRSGLVAGYVEGKIDSVIMRVLDAILAFPVILLAILVVASLGTRTINLVLTIGFVFIPYFTRLVRGNVMARQAARVRRGEPRRRGRATAYLVCRVIFPNVLSPVVVQASLTMSLAVLIEAALSFLGLGVQEPTPAWGSMLQSRSSTCSKRPGTCSPPAPASSSRCWLQPGRRRPARRASIAGGRERVKTRREGYARRAISSVTAIA